MRLDDVEARIVGSLVEKQLTVPQQYPLSSNSLVSACNQTSNRDPVVNYSEAEVEAALNSLKAKGFVRFVLPSHGRSVVRYRHVLDEKLALDQRQMALVAVLLLRGPQTAGELRGRTERMAGFDSVADVESDLEGLTRWEEPLVIRLARRPGQKEERWAQLLAEGGAESSPAPAGFVPAASEGARPVPEAVDWRAGAGHLTPGAGEWGDEAGHLRAGGGDLRAEVASLRHELQLLGRQVARIRAELGMDDGGPNEG